MQDIYGKTLLQWALSVASANCLIEHGFDSATSGMQSTWVSPTLWTVRTNGGETPLDKAKRENNMNIALIIFEANSEPCVACLSTFTLQNNLLTIRPHEECRNPRPERVPSSGQSNRSRRLQLHRDASNLKAFCGASKIRNVSIKPSQGLS